MPEFPRRIALKKHKCPTCGDDLGAPVLSHFDATVRVVCGKEVCGYAVDLGWLGDLKPSAN